MTVQPTLLHHFREFHFSTPEYSDSGGEESDSGYNYLSDDMLSTSPPSASQPAATKPTDNVPRGSGEIDWNLAFKMIRALPDSVHKYQALSKLAKDFAHAATLYAKVRP